MTVLLTPTFRRGVALPAIPNPKIFIWGQSNAGGQAKDANPGQVQVPHYLRTQEARFGRANVWEPCGLLCRDQGLGAAGVDFYPTKHGIPHQLGADLLAAGKSPIIVTCSKGGTPISNWYSGAAGRTHIDGVAAEVFAQGISNTGWHIVTLHGETGGNAGTYAADMATLVAYLRTHFPSARVYCVKVNSVLGMTACEASQASFCSADGNAELVNFDGFSYDGIHYYSAGYNSGGSLIATRILANM